MGVIGYRNHANRILNIIEESVNDVNLFVYHPKKKINPINTNELSDLLMCKCVFILSPNKTHLDYICFLINNNYLGKIFCEKPPVSSNKELEVLLKILKGRQKDVYFNFNFRHSYIKKIIESQDILEKPINLNLSLTHGLAFKEHYKDSWRSQKGQHSLGIIETVGIHWIDLFQDLFGSIEKSYVDAKIVSKVGDAYDSANILMKHKTGVNTNIFVSYATCKNFSLEYQCTNGLLKIESKSLKVRYPRNTFDKNGFFTLPGIKSELEYDYNLDYNQSLKHSVNFFLNCVIHNKDLPTSEFNKSIETNKFLFTLEA